MDRLQSLYNASHTYPANLHCHQIYQHVLEGYQKELQIREKRLCHPRKASVDVWQCSDTSSGFTAKSLASVVDVHNEIGFTAGPDNPPTDPLCRFSLIHARHSREWLNITKDMLLALLSYHQVMPAFLDLVFCFGRQEEAEDFFYTTFKSECRLDDKDPGLRVPGLGRSGQNIQLCYNLRSVDFDDTDSRWKFRNTGIYHSFDANTGRANWIVLRGDQSIKNKLNAALQSPQLHALRSLDTSPQRLQAALVGHLCFCEWSTQNWKAFVNYLESIVRKYTAEAHDKAASEVKDPARAIAMLSRSQTAPQQPARSTTLTSLIRRDSIRTLERRFTGRLHRPGSSNTAVASSQPTIVEEKSETIDEDIIGPEYDLAKMQAIEGHEERANAALLIVKSDQEVLNQLSQFYSSLHKRADFPKFWGKSYDTAIFQFTSRVAELQSELRHHQARLETLLVLLADRKTLIHGIIQYRGMEASKKLAESTHQSALEMQDVTMEMSEISKRTQKDTVSMRIITIITLIFLPGTFISTLMSTDIIRFPSENGGPPTRVFSRKALDLFLIICLPLMFVTLMAWIVTQYILNRRAQAEKIKDEKATTSA